MKVSRWFVLVFRVITVFGVRRMECLQVDEGGVGRWVDEGGWMKGGWVGGWMRGGG